MTPEEQAAADAATKATADAAAKATADAAAKATADAQTKALADARALVDANQPKAPDAYTAFTKPAGELVDDADLVAWSAVAKQRGWTQAQAQAQLEAHAESLATQAETYLTATKAHTEVGGAHLEMAQLHARQALDKFLPDTTPEGQALRAGLNKTGFGNWTPLVLLLSRIGKAMAEDGGAGKGGGGGGGGSAKTIAQTLYGDSPKT